MSKSLAYRPDIDGLRAVAVAAVLAFHGFPLKLPGGFVGVDVFFVISGFLITGIILKELKAERFTIAGFYSRRVRRIFPALFLVLTATLLLGWAFLLPHEFRQLAKHTAAGVGFVSNLVFWQESGYFDTAAQAKPLLHLWSLGIEEQFYIVWPLLLAFLFRRTRRLVLAIGCLTLASFCLNLVLASRDATADYYNPGARGWELLIGALLARYLGEGSRPLGAAARQALAILGAVSIAIALILTSDKVPFPGWWALLPTLGTASLILAGEDTWINRQVLSSRPFVFVGQISYPLYLWHWPLLTYFRVVNISDYDLPYYKIRLATLALLGLSVALAWATWHFVETPVRLAKAAASTRTVVRLSGALAAVAMAALFVLLGTVPPRLGGRDANRLVAALTDWPIVEHDNFKASIFQSNRLRTANPAVTLFIGDSHAFQYVPRVRLAQQRNPSLATAEFTTYGCTPLPGVQRDQAGWDCAKYYDHWTREAASAHTVVIASYWESFLVHNPVPWEPSMWKVWLNSSGKPLQAADLDSAFNRLGDTIRSWVDSGKRVVLISSNPGSNRFNPEKAVRRLEPLKMDFIAPLSRDDLNQYLQPVESRLTALAARSGARLIRPADYVCWDGVCPAIDAQGELMYIDSHHLRARSVEKWATFIDELLLP